MVISIWPFWQPTDFFKIWILTISPYRWKTFIQFFGSIHFFLDRKVILLPRIFFQQPLPKTDIPRDVFSFVVIRHPNTFHVVSVPGPFSLSPNLHSCFIFVLRKCLYTLHHWWDGSRVIWGSSLIHSQVPNSLYLCVKMFSFLQISEEGVVGRYSSLELNHSTWLLEETNKQTSYIHHLSCIHPSSQSAIQQLVIEHLLFWRIRDA